MIRGTITNNRPIIQVDVQNGQVIAGGLAPGTTTPTVTVLALLDTGATKTVITQRLALSLQLPVYGTGTLAVGNGTSSAAATYLCALFLPGHPKPLQVKCGSIPEPLGGCDVVIGIDILTMGKLTLERNKFTLLIPAIKK